MDGLLKELTDRWGRDGIPPVAGLPPETIASFEKREGVELSDDLRSYFLATDGMGPDYSFDNAMINFVSLGEMKPLPKVCDDCGEVVDEEESYYLFGDHSIGIVYFAVRLDAHRDDVIAYLPSRIDHRWFRKPERTPPNVFQRWPSFSEFLQAYCKDPMSCI